MVPSHVDFRAVVAMGTVLKRPVASHANVNVAGERMAKVDVICTKRVYFSIKTVCTQRFEMIQS